MLARKFRLTGASRFASVEKKGRIFQSDSFGLAYFAKDSGPSNFGFVVSNKISKNSSERNRIKRALREGVREMITEVKSGMDIVFLAKQRISTKTTDEIINEVKIALIDAKLIK